MNEQKELQQIKDNYINLFNTIDDMVFVLDNKGKIITVNETVCLKLGYKRSQLIDKTILMLHDKAKMIDVKKAIKDIITGKARNYTIPFLTKNNKYIPIEAKVSVGTWDGEKVIYAIAKDLSELKMSEEKFSKAFNTNPSMMLISTIGDVTYLDVNKAVIKTFGYKKTEIIGKKLADFDLFVDKKEIDKMKKILRKREIIKNYEISLKDKQGKTHTCLCTMEKITVGNKPCWLTTLIDITQQKQTQNELYSKQLMLNAVAEATNELLLNNNLKEAIYKSLEIMGKALDVDRVYCYQHDFHNQGIFYRDSQSLIWKSRYYNNNLCNEDECLICKQDRIMTKLKHGEIIIRDLNLKDNDAIGKVMQQFKILQMVVFPIFINDRFWGFIGADEYEIPLPWKESELSALTSFTNAVVNAINRNMHENEIKYLSYHDQLTDLYNRRFYEEELKRLDVKRNLPLSIIVGDVNKLKLINDTYGHDMGDKYLKRIGELIVLGCREDDIIARLGGDEFVVILPHTTSSQAKEIIKRITMLVSKEKIESIDMSISFGCKTKTSMEQNTDDIFKISEDNMYCNKMYSSSNTKSKSIGDILNTLFENHKIEKGHSIRVGKYSSDIGLKLGFSRSEIDELRLAGSMHDIGKIGILETILDKPSALTNEEYNEIKKHSEIGYRILSSTREYTNIARSVLEHHERFDGKGYPKGLKKEEIDIHSRIIAIADAYDAMVSARTYGKVLSKKEAIDELIKNSGTQFDPEIVTIFIEQVLNSK